MLSMVCGDLIERYSAKGKSSNQRTISDCIKSGFRSSS